MKEVDADKHRVRGTFPDRQDLLSPWLDVPVRDALDDKEYSLPSVGAQVAVLLDEHGDSGCVIGALYSDADPAPAAGVDIRRWTMKDGTKLEYDRAAHTLTLDVKGDVLVKVDGLLKVAGAGDFVALAQKVDTAFQNIVTWLTAHVHPTGVGPSGPPTPPPTGQASTAATKTRTD